MSQRRISWGYAPGEAHDKRGIPIFPGDLCKSHHFTEHNGRNHWLYHVAVEVDGVIKMIPTSHLEPTKVKQGGSCFLSKGSNCLSPADFQIISGHGPGGILDYLDRPRKKPAPLATGEGT